MEIGSPSGATCSTITSSPGKQPISISFNSKSELWKHFILPLSPCFKSDSFISKIKAIAIDNKAFTIFEMIYETIYSIPLYF